MHIWFYLRWLLNIFFSLITGICLTDILGGMFIHVALPSKETMHTNAYYALTNNDHILVMLVMSFLYVGFNLIMASF